MPPGRITKLNRERADRILEALRVGATRGTACRRAGIDITTMERWIRLAPRGGLYSEFAEQVTRAENDAELLATSVVMKVIQGGSVLSRRTRTTADGRQTIDETFAPPDGHLALEYLARRLPREWGKIERIELSVRQRAQELADELGLPVEVVMAEAQRVALAKAVNGVVKALPSGEKAG